VLFIRAVEAAQNTMNVPCKHSRLRSVVLLLEPAEPHQLKRVLISTCCDECGVVFEFAPSNFIGISEDRQELTIAIVEVSKGRVQ